MNTDEKSRLKIVCVYLCSSVAILLLSGCAKPNPANITLRKENQSLHDQIEQLNLRHDADAATIRSLEQALPTVERLPDERVALLFTTHGIRFNRLTGGADLDPSKPGDDGVKVYLEPFDQDGNALKAAGSVVIETFDLASEGQTRLGRCEFDTAAARAAWVSGGLLYEYVLACPFQTQPRHSQITIKATFTDELTRRQFTAQKVVDIDLPQPPSALAK